MDMEAYRKILTRIGKIFLLVILLASALAGILCYPVIAFWGSGFQEGRLVTTLSIMLAGLCLARLLAACADKSLTGKQALLLVLGALSALCVLLLREHLPFVLRGYVFPLVTGTVLPYLLLSYLSKSETVRRSHRVLAALAGSTFLLLAVWASYGAVFSSELARMLLCRTVALPLVWVAPLWTYYARRCRLAGAFSAVAVGIFPLFPILGILWETVFRLTPVGLLLCLVALGLDRFRLKNG